MAGFLYFLPSQRPTAPKIGDVRAAGLSYAFEREYVPRQTMSGPGGVGEGHVLGVSADGLGFYPERQEWRKVPGTAAWVGYLRDSLPTPDDLIRAEPLRGHLVPLCDGNRWLCPVARGVADIDGQTLTHIALPGVLRLNDEGEWISGGIEARHQSLWTLAERFWDVFSKAIEGAADDGQAAFDFAGLADGSVECLAANYRMSRVEVAILGLLDTNATKAGLILQSLIDWPAWEAIIKKKAEAATSHGDAGQPAAT